MLPLLASFHGGHRTRLVPKHSPSLMHQQSKILCIEERKENHALEVDLDSAGHQRLLKEISRRAGRPVIVGLHESQLPEVAARRGSEHLEGLSVQVHPELLGSFVDGAAAMRRCLRRQQSYWWNLSDPASNKFEIQIRSYQPRRNAGGSLLRTLAICLATDGFSVTSMTRLFCSSHKASGRCFESAWVAFRATCCIPC